MPTIVVMIVRISADQKSQIDGKKKDISKINIKAAKEPAVPGIILLLPLYKPVAIKLQHLIWTGSLLRFSFMLIFSR